MVSRYVYISRLHLLTNFIDYSRSTIIPVFSSFNQQIVFVFVAQMNLTSTCKDLTALQKCAKNQIHRFKFFEYLQIVNFDVTIKSVHHFEADDVDFLLVNLERCYLNIFFYNGSEFTMAQSKDDFDAVEKWTTLKYKGATYFLTIGSGSCGRSIGNLWKFEQETMVVSVTFDSHLVPS